MNTILDYDFYNLARVYTTIFTGASCIIFVVLLHLLDMRIYKESQHVPRLWLEYVDDIYVE